MAKFELISTVDIEINKIQSFGSTFKKFKQYYINIASSELSNNYIKPVKINSENEDIQNKQKYATTKFRKGF